MSAKLKYALTFSFLFLFGFTSSWFVTNQTDPLPSRSIASLQNSSTVHMEKHLMPLQLTIQGPDSFPKNPEEAVTLKATIRTPFPNFTYINYRWSLPEDVELVKGPIANDIQNPVANKPYEIEILVKGFDNGERKEITLLATTMDPDGQNLGNAVVITSRPEDSMEHIAPAMMLKAQEFKAQHDRLPASDTNR